MITAGAPPRYGRQRKRIRSRAVGSARSMRGPATRGPPITLSPEIEIVPSCPPISPVTVDAATCRSRCTAAGTSIVSLTPLVRVTRGVGSMSTMRRTGTPAPLSNDRSLGFDPPSCVVCGSQLEKDRTRFCSRRCNRKHYKRETAMKKNTDLVRACCITCEREFLRPAKSQRTLFKFHREKCAACRRPDAVAPCRICGEKISTAKHRGRPPKYCSDDCRLVAHRPIRKKWYDARKVAPQTAIVFGYCDECGRYHARRQSSTMSAFVRSGGVLRCYSCASKRRKNLKRKRDRERRQEWKATGDPRYLNLCERENQKSHRRRVKIKEAPSDLSASDVIKMKKAATQCALCGGALPAKVSSRPLDHIIPIFANGTHTRDNVRVLCVACNSSRPKDGSDVSDFQMNLWMARDDA